MIDDRITSVWENPTCMRYLPYDEQSVKPLRRLLALSIVLPPLTSALEQQGRSPLHRRCTKPYLSDETQGCTDESIGNAVLDGRRSSLYGKMPLPLFCMPWDAELATCMMHRLQAQILKHKPVVIAHSRENVALQSLSFLRAESLAASSECSESTKLRLCRVNPINRMAAY